MARSFKYDLWDFDGDGNAYIIAKSECPRIEDVPQFLVEEERISPDFKPEMVVEQGWCKYQMRSDWDNMDGPCGGYVVEQRENRPAKYDGTPKRGWFPVWIVRRGKWYD